MIDLNSLRFFIITAQHESLTAAAEKLDLPKSRLSRHVKSLEEELGFRLFFRHHNRLQLTTEGDQLRQQYEPIFQRFEQQQDWILNRQSMPSGRLTLSAPADLLNTHFSDTLADFCLRYPEIKLDCQVSSVFDHVAADDFDIALLIKDFQLPDGDYIARPIFQVQSGLYAAPKLIATAASPIEKHWQTLPRIGHRQQNHWVLQHQQRLTSVQLDAVIRIDSIHTQLSMAVRGLGIVRLPKFFAQDAVNAGELELINSEQQPVPFEVCLAYREHQFLPKKVQVFIDYYQSNAPDMAL